MYTKYSWNPELATQLLLTHVVIHPQEVWFGLGRDMGRSVVIHLGDLLIHRVHWGQNRMIFSTSSCNLSGILPINLTFSKLVEKDLFSQELAQVVGWQS